MKNTPLSVSDEDEEEDRKRKQEEREAFEKSQRDATDSLMNTLNSINNL
jgi:hypothetical protein